jgi:tetratricopeptide (TPR) repeat protein
MLTEGRASAYANLERGKSEEAYVELKRLSELWPDDLETAKLLVVAAYRTGRVCLAGRLLRRVTREDPEDRWMQLHVGRVLAAAGRYDDAMRVYEAIPRHAQESFEARLGEACIAAWRWRTAEATAAAEALVARRPRHADALTLLGDLKRWDWALTEAHTRYTDALDAEPNHPAAKAGLEWVDANRSARLEAGGGAFHDSTGLRRAKATASFRALLWDRTEIAPQLAYWEFKRSGALVARRVDESVQVRHHFSRHLEANVLGMSYDYDIHRSAQSVAVATKWSPAPVVDAYANAAWHEPVTENVHTVVSDLHQDAYGVGIDLHRWKLSLAANGSHSNYSDTNTRRHGRVEVSYTAWLSPYVVGAFAYDVLDYAKQVPEYFSPRGYQSLGPELRAAHRLVGWLSFHARAGLPYYVSEGGFGYEVAGGATVQWLRLMVSGSYVKQRSPSQTDPWSGDGFEIALAYAL